MIRTSGFLNSYSPVEKIGDNAYRINWDCTEIPSPIYAELTQEEQLKEQSGEFVEHTIIGYKESEMCMYMTEVIYGESILNTAKKIITDWYDKQTKDKIISGFVWNDMQIWLSQENQFNYKAAYDLAVQSGGETLPITFKFGTPDNPIYYTFKTLEEFRNFYTSMISHINQTLTEGWQKKDSINWSDYDYKDE